MNKNNTMKKFQWNAVTGMAVGVLVAALFALVVSIDTGDPSIWVWAIPTGLASGLVIGAGKAWQRNA